MNGANSTQRQGDWIATNSGMKWYVLDPRPEDVRLDDIAHGLSLVCRYGGQCRQHYSVAQHSVLVSRVLAEWEPENYALQLHGLLHDAAEAYIGDVVRPLKVNLPLYRTLERSTELVIFRALGVPLLSDEQMEWVKAADDTMLVTERRDIVNHGGRPWTPRIEPREEVVRPWAANGAKIFFLQRWKELSEKAGAEPLQSALGQPVEAA